MLSINSNQKVWDTTKIHKIFHNIPKQSHYEVTGN